MSIQNDIRSALSEDPQTLAAIVEATGHETRQVANGLAVLRSKGEAQRDSNGWIAGATAPPPRVHKHEAADPKASAPAKRRGRPRGTRTKQKGKRRGRAPKASATDPTAIQAGRFGEFIVLRAGDLRELLATLERWRALARVHA